MTKREIKKILDDHKHYLAQNCDGWENMRANLRNADLRGADLRGADLSNADLYGADLRHACMCDANLSNANLYGADLSDANLSNACLSDACISNAKLCHAFLSGSNLKRACLYGADLSNACLRHVCLRNTELNKTNLSRACLYGSDLSNADLSYADLSYAAIGNTNLTNVHFSTTNLNGVKYDEKTSFFALVCPEEGDFIAWKKVDNVIIKMRVPSEAKRSSATTRKCRCEYAEVLELQNLDGTPYKEDKIVNYNFAKETIYKVGEIVRPDSWDDNRWNECSNGIHFFITRDEAVRY